MKIWDVKARLEETGRRIGRWQGCSCGLASSGLSSWKLSPVRRPMAWPRFQRVRAPFFFLLETLLRRSIQRRRFQPG